MATYPHNPQTDFINTKKLPTSDSAFFHQSNYVINIIDLVVDNLCIIL